MKFSIGKLLGAVLFILFIVTFYLWMTGNECGSTCDSSGFLNPLGFNDNSSLGANCMQLCTKYHPSPFFYLAADIFAIFSVITIAYLLLKPHRDARSAE
ncbi:hypothetical protein KC660_02185 [Candidatus Dojkabacteria bacterium]|uniref:Uncharacterized protein n=1 Tax=Candidatus Dojkabacteria bacterium TaxID=2099670 RepID=A0A955L3E0_9BACT|nr:hypothetical protein [Candidatus Dojkabacteria bacterium]